MHFLWIVLLSILASSLALRVKLQTGSNLSPLVANRLESYLAAIPDVTVENVKLTDFDLACDASQGAEEEPTLILSLGSTPLTALLSFELSKLENEAFVLKVDKKGSNCATILTNGNALHVDGSPSLNTHEVHLGAVYGAYHAMELLGFRFLQPLRPVLPASLSLDRLEDGHVTEEPFWEERGFHIHTQHPLELTEVLNGFSIPMFGPLGPGCSREGHGESYCETWEEMVPDVLNTFEWCVVNKLNRVEWLLLGNFKWGPLTDSTLRQDRLKLLNSFAHQFGLLVHADVPLAEMQQHAWYMVNTRKPFDQQIEDIHTRVDWLFEANFDAISTESGLSEFTFPDCSLMLDLLNEFSIYVNETWGRQASVKVHCSTGQECEDYPDPRTGEPINFNFLPTYASSDMGVLPHTVQAYSLDDPTGTSYGNDDFSAIKDYMDYEARLHNRSVVFYPETAYWVNVDVDVPLFLPLYGERRVYDLRMIGQLQAESEGQEDAYELDGIMNFDSGWEWGYWFSDVITARAMWNPMVNEKMTNQEAFLAMMKPVASILSTPELQATFKELILSLTDHQYKTLIMGEVEGQPSQDLSKLSGFPYMSGDDTWVDLPRMIGISLTQPDKVHMDETDDELYPYVQPLLREMEKVFGEDASLASSFLAACVASGEDAMVMELMEEIVDSIQLLALRASQVRRLYQSKDPATATDLAQQLRAESRGIIAEAQEIVVRREAQYRVPRERIGAWRNGPTVYRYGYVWAVHSLYYWWRDQGLAEGGSVEAQQSPCYLNRIDSTEVAVGFGKHAFEALRVYVNQYSPHENADLVVNCISPPPYEYEFPDDLYIF